VSETPESEAAAERASESHRVAVASEPLRDDAEGVRAGDHAGSLADLRGAARGTSSGLSRSLRLARAIVVGVALASLLSPVPFARHTYHSWDDEPQVRAINEFSGIELVMSRDLGVWIMLAAWFAALTLLVAERWAGPRGRGSIALATFVVMPVAGLLMSQLESVLHLQLVGLLAEEQLLIGGWLARGAAPVFLILTLATAVAAFSGGGATARTR
jgi:hypothetical protein